MLEDLIIIVGNTEHSQIPSRLPFSYQFDHVCDERVVVVFIFLQHPISRQTLNCQMNDTVIPTQLPREDIVENKENSGDLSQTFDTASCV